MIEAGFPGKRNGGTGGTWTRRDASLLKQDHFHRGFDLLRIGGIHSMSGAEPRFRRGRQNHDWGG